MTRDSRRDGHQSSWFQALQAFSTEIRRTFGPLRSFRIEAWATIPILAFWLALSALDRAFAASNAVLLCVVGGIACLVGGRLGELRAWPATVLVPRYGQSLFLLCLTTVGSATAFGVLWSWWLGNPFPAIGPALLICVAAMVGAMRVPAVLVVATVLSFTPLLVLFLAFAMPFDLSGVWYRLGSLAGVGLIAFRLWRGLTRPPIRFRQVGQPPVAFGRFPSGDLKVSAKSLGGTLLVLVPLWYWAPHWLDFLFVMAWFLALGNALFSSWFTVHVQLSRDWTFGIAADRKDLGRRAGVRLLWISLPSLVLGLVVAGIHASFSRADGGFLFDDVLIVQSVTVACFAALYASTRRLPPSQPFRFLIGVPWMGLTCGACGALTFLDYTAWAYSALVLAVVGAGAFAVGVGGPALARAEILSDALIQPGFSGQGR